MERGQDTLPLMTHRSLHSQATSERTPGRPQAARGRLLFSPLSRCGLSLDPPAPPPVSHPNVRVSSYISKSQIQIYFGKKQSFSFLCLGINMLFHFLNLYHVKNQKRELKVNQSLRLRNSSAISSRILSLFLMGLWGKVI